MYEYMNPWMVNHENLGGRLQYKSIFAEAKEYICMYCLFSHLLPHCICSNICRLKGYNTVTWMPVLFALLWRFAFYVGSKLDDLNEKKWCDSFKTCKRLIYLFLFMFSKQLVDSKPELRVVLNKLTYLFFRCHSLHLKILLAIQVKTSTIRYFVSQTLGGKVQWYCKSRYHCVLFVYCTTISDEKQIMNAKKKKKMPQKKRTLQQLITNRRSNPRYVSNVF